MDHKQEYTDLFEYIKNKENQKFISKINKIMEEDITFDVNITDTNNKHFLNYAVVTNNIEIVKFLIEKNARIDIENDEISILAITIFYSYNEVLKLLLETNKNIIGVNLINYRDKNNKTPIHYAIMVKNIIAIDLLLEYDANVDIVDKDKYNALFYAVKSRNLNICKKIMQYTSNINAKCNTGENVLHIACNFQLYEIAELLIKNNITVNIHDIINEITPLHYCVLLNNTKLVNLLLTNNANPNLQDIYGNTPLHYTIIENNYEIFNILLNCENINYNLWNIEGEIPMHQIFKLKTIDANYLDKIIEKSNLNIQDKYGNSCFYYLIKYDIWKKYLFILKKKKLNIFLLNKDREYIFDLVVEKDKDIFFDLLSESYFHILKTQTKNWSEDIDLECSNNNNISSFEIIKTCKSKIKKKLQSIIQKTKDNKDLSCSEKSYPIVRPTICVSIQEGKNLQFCSFTGTLLDILIGLLYLHKKYKRELCFIINGEINKKDICAKYKLGNMINGDRCELINFEIIWSNKRLYYNDNFDKKFISCITSNKKFVIIPLGIEMKEGSHAGYLIYDIETKELERFETYGSGVSLYGTYYDSSLLDDKLEQKFKEIDEKIKYIKPSDFLPKISFQLMDITEREKKKIGDPFGFCALWSIWYVDNRIKYKEISRDKLVNILIKELKAKNISFKNMIRNYAVDIIQIRDEILNKANLDINDWINEQYNDEQFITILDEINKLIKK